MPIISLDSLPHRIFLDSSTLQTMQTYGEFIYDNVEVERSNRIWSIPNGIENLDAIRKLILVNQRAGFEFAISENTLSEVAGRKDSQYLQWALEVLDYWHNCFEESSNSFKESCNLAAKLDGNSFGYLGVDDRLLIKDALLLECDAFLTMENRLPKNSAHIQRELGIKILTPLQHWELLRPWASLLA